MSEPSCPRCGGVAQRSIAPGLWECTAIVSAPAFEQRQVAGAPSGHFAPQPVPSSRVCGHRYQALVPGAPEVAEPCTCGTFAIGRCQRCQSPICGDHSGLIDAARVCSTCWAGAVSEQRSRRAEGALGQMRSARASAFVQVSDIADPMERLVRSVQWLADFERSASFWAAVAHVIDPTFPGGAFACACRWYRNGDFWGAPNVAALRADYEEETLQMVRAANVEALVCPAAMGFVAELDLGGRMLEPWGDRPPWDPQRLLAWAIERRQSLPPVEVRICVRRARRFGGQKLVVESTASGWQIDRRVRHSGQDYSMTSTVELWHLLVDGRIVSRVQGDWAETEVRSDVDFRLLDLLGADLPGSS